MYSRTIDKALQCARDSFNRNTTRNVDFRIDQLRKLRQCVEEHEEQLIEALKQDLNKPPFETVMMEISYVKIEIDYQLENIRKFTKPKYVNKAMVYVFDDCYIKYEPLGVVCIFGTWNYPIYLLLCPLVGAIAAGNCALVKPSELAPNTEKLWSQLLPKYLDQNCYPVLTGGVEFANQLLREKFDLIFFSGSTKIGKLVYEAAAKNLTPVVLELGGKCPVYIDDSVAHEMDTVAKRILWGKTVNAGQTCIAPDYVLCTVGVQEKLVKACKRALKEFFGENAKKSESFSRIIDEKHFDRLAKLLTNSKGDQLFGGQTDRNTNYVSPTIVTNVSPTDSLMSEEIFGPILPIVIIGSPEEAIDFINQGEKPLAVYLFSNQCEIVNEFLEQTSSGSVCVNDTLFQMGAYDLPNGGIGNSGIGQYQGRYSFETFSHAKSVLARSLNPVLERLSSARYPPYTEENLNWMKALAVRTRLDGIRFKRLFSYFVIFLFGIVVMSVIRFIF